MRLNKLAGFLNELVDSMSSKSVDVKVENIEYDATGIKCHYDKVANQIKITGGKDGQIEVNISEVKILSAGIYTGEKLPEGQHRIKEL